MVPGQHMVMLAPIKSFSIDVFLFGLIVLSWYKLPGLILRLLDLMFFLPWASFLFHWLICLFSWTAFYFVAWHWSNNFRPPFTYSTWTERTMIESCLDELEPHLPLLWLVNIKWLSMNLLPHKVLFVAVKQTCCFFLTWDTR